MPPLPVVPEGSSDYRDARCSHSCQSAIEVSNLSSLPREVGIWATCVEAACDPVTYARSGEMLGQQVGMTEWVAEQILAGLVQVLPVHKHTDSGAGIGGEGTHLG